MTENNIQTIRLELVELIDKTEELLTVINNMGHNLKQEAMDCEPLEWFDFTIVLDRLAVSMTMLHERLNGCRDLD